jgi:hypothetical protein
MEIIPTERPCAILPSSTSEEYKHEGYVYNSSLIGFSSLLSVLTILLLLLRGTGLGGRPPRKHRPLEPDQHRPTHITGACVQQQQQQEEEEVIVAGQDTCLVSVAGRKCSNKEVMNRY